MYGLTVAGECISLLAFWHKSSMCTFNFNLLSIFVSSNFSNILLLIVSLPIFSSLWFVERIRKWHLSWLAYIWLSLFAFCFYLKLIDNFSGTFIGSVRRITIYISYTKSMLLIMRSRSQRSMLNKSGSSIKPCGIPKKISCH